MSWWTPPLPIEARAHRRKSRLINSLLWTALALAPIGFATAPFVADPPLYCFIIYAGIFAFSAIALLLNRWAPAWWHPAATCSLFAFVTSLCVYWAMGESNSVVMLAFVTVIFIAGLLWGKRPAIVIGALILGITFVGALSESLNPAPVVPTPLGSWIGFAVLVAINALMLGATIRNLQELLRELTLSKEELATLVSSFPDGIVRMRPDGVVASVNAAAQQLIGPEADVIGRPLYEVEGLYEDSVARARRLVESSMNGVGVDERLTILRDGHEVVFQVRIGAFPVGRTTGGIVLALRDVTAQIEAQRERERLRQQVLRQQKLDSVGRLAGGIAHDFNNLLTIIRANAEFMSSEGELSANQHECLDDLRQAAERCASFTHRLLTLSRDHDPGREELVPDTVAASVTPVFHRTLGPNIALEQRLDSNSASVIGNAAELEAAFLNLLLNARDAVREAGTITIASDLVELTPTEPHHLPVPRAGTYYRLCVSDDGRGMDAETLEHATEPFFTTKEAGRGTGLGLATVYQLMKQLDGGLDLASAPQQGTTVSLFVPLGESDPHDDSPHPLHGIELSEQRVLLVEDDPGVCATTKRTLERAGYSVESVACGASALSWIKQNGPPDILLTDILLPGISGIELAENVTKRWPETRVLHISGFTGSSDERTVFPLLPKPFSPAELIAFVREQGPLKH